MRVPKLRMAALALASGISLGGCAYDMGYGGYGGGYGYGAPYSSVSVGVGFGGGYGYGSSYGGYGYGSPFGWYDDFYYPGTGIYVYDSYRRPRVWNDRQRYYWSHRSGDHHNWDGHGRQNHNSGTTIQPNGSNAGRPNWSGFDHRQPGTATGGRGPRGGRHP